MLELNTRLVLTVLSCIIGLAGLTACTPTRLLDQPKPSATAMIERTDPDGLIIRDHSSDSQDSPTAAADAREIADAPLTPDELAERMREYIAAAAARPSATADRAEFDPFIARNCPPEGAARTSSKAASNRLKNRTAVPRAADIDQRVTLGALRRRGNDVDRWSTARAVTIDAYVSKVTGTGPESCNCGATERRLTDTHIDLHSGPGDTALPVIAEITPVWRLIHEHRGLEDWSSTAIRNKYAGKRVRITGWLYYDSGHRFEDSNSDPSDIKDKKNWRATCWEIHPVTKIELLN
jgi:hypothetical protein